MTTTSVQPFAAPKSEQLSASIAELIPGGVDSPFRSFKEVGGHTIFFTKGDGARLHDVDGNVFLDFLGAWGPAILGHCHPDIVAACQKAIADGPVFGAPHESELELATLVRNAFRSIEMVRFVNSGTEAVMSAVRLARGYTGRDLVIMFEGCYHGHSDSVLASRQHSSSAGIPSQFSEQTLLVPFNDTEALRNCLEENKSQIAAVLIEPVAGSMGVVPPRQGYLESVRELCTKHGALLIFDEVLTGLRLSRGGAQELYTISPDLTCLGKALGGGMPIGAYGGRRDVMLHLEPIGKVYQAGTFSGNPLTMAGGIATLKLLQHREHYEQMESVSTMLFEGVGAAVRKNRWPVQLQRVGSMFSFVFAGSPVTNYKESLSIDANAFARFYHELLRRGVYLAPSAVDACAISAVHTRADIEQAIEACVQALHHTW